MEAFWLLVCLLVLFSFKKALLCSPGSPCTYDLPISASWVWAFGLQACITTTGLLRSQVLHIARENWGDSVFRNPQETSCSGIPRSLKPEQMFWPRVSYRTLTPAAFSVLLRNSASSTTTLSGHEFPLHRVDILPKSVFTWPCPAPGTDQESCGYLVNCFKKKFYPCGEEQRWLSRLAQGFNSSLL